MSDKGSIAALVATYLAIILLAVLGVSVVGTAMLAGNRIQGVADYAVLFGHDRAIRVGVPVESRLDKEVRNFLDAASSAKRIEVVELASWVDGETSNVRLCGRFRDVFEMGFDSMVICRAASAKSFLLP